MNDFLIYVKNTFSILTFQSNRDSLLQLNSKLDVSIAIFCVYLLLSSLTGGVALSNIIISTVIFGGFIYLSGPLFSNIFYLAGVGASLVLLVLILVGLPVRQISLLFFVWQLIAYFVAFGKIQKG